MLGRGAYAPCPAGAAEIAAAMTPVPRRGSAASLSFRLSARRARRARRDARRRDADLGALAATAAPTGVRAAGTHSKWARSSGRIVDFATFMTARFAALKDHTLLGRLMTPPDGSDAASAPTPSPAASPLRCARSAGDLLHATS